MRDEAGRDGRDAGDDRDAKRRAADQTNDGYGPTRTVTTREWMVAGRVVARYLLIEELGHAWSGGDDKYPYNDPRPPDASAMLGAFVRHPMQ